MDGSLRLGGNYWLPEDQDTLGADGNSTTRHAPAFSAHKTLAHSSSFTTSSSSMFSSHFMTD